MSTPLAPLPPLPPGPRPARRRPSKHWTTRQFRATFKEFRFRWDWRLKRQIRTAHLVDVYDGTNTLVTLHWTVDCPASLAAMCRHEGCTVHFDAEYSATSYEAERAGVPLLRGPFRAVGRGGA